MFYSKFVCFTPDTRVLLQIRGYYLQARALYLQARVFYSRHACFSYQARVFNLQTRVFFLRTRVFYLHARVLYLQIRVFYSRHVCITPDTRVLPPDGVFYLQTACYLQTRVFYLQIRVYHYWASYLPFGYNAPGFSSLTHFPCYCCTVLKINAMQLPWSEVKKSFRSFLLRGNWAAMICHYHTNHITLHWIMSL